MIETEGTSVVSLAAPASVVEGGVLGGGEGTGSSVDDVGGTWVKGSVDKAGTLVTRLAEDDIAKQGLAKPTMTNIYFTTRSAGGEN